MKIAYWRVVICELKLDGVQIDFQYDHVGKEARIRQIIGDDEVNVHLHYDRDWNRGELRLSSRFPTKLENAIQALRDKEGAIHQILE